MTNKYNIHEGEGSIIALAKKHSVDYCLIDERKPRNVAKSEGFKVVGSLGIIINAFKIGEISEKEYLSIFTMIQKNPEEYRFHPNLIAKFIDKIKSDF